MKRSMFTVPRRIRYRFKPCVDLVNGYSICMTYKSLEELFLKTLDVLRRGKRRELSVYDIDQTGRIAYVLNNDLKTLVYLDTVPMMTLGEILEAFTKGRVTLDENKIKSMCMEECRNDCEIGECDEGFDTCVEFCVEYYKSQGAD